MTPLSLLAIGLLVLGIAELMGNICIRRLEKRVIQLEMKK